MKHDPWVTARLKHTFGPLPRHILGRPTWRTMEWKLWHWNPLLVSF